MRFERTATGPGSTTTPSRAHEERAARVALSVACLGFLLAGIGEANPTRLAVPSAIAGGPSTSKNLKVAFIGDGGPGVAHRRVLEMIDAEDADMVIHSGDFDYRSNPEAWDAQISDILGRDFPYFACVGNHDRGAWPGYQRKLRERLARVKGAECSGTLGIQSACTYKGLFFILSAAGMIGRGHGAYIREQLARDDHVWSVCAWHYNQTAMQVGGKGNQAGWDVYEEAIRGGAIVATAHEHSYGRTRTLTHARSQTVDGTCPGANDLCVSPGRSFVFHSGLGGRSVRRQMRCLPATFPYGCHGEWARIYTSDQGAIPGALFIVFNLDGDPLRARGYFKNVEGEVIDDFAITAAPRSVSEAPSGPSSPGSSTAAPRGKSRKAPATARP